MNPINISRASHTTLGSVEDLTPKAAQQLMKKVNIEARASQTQLLEMLKTIPLGERKIRAGNLINKDVFTVFLGKASTYANVKDAMMRAAFALTEGRLADPEFGSLHKSALRLADQYNKLVEGKAPEAERLSTLRSLRDTLAGMQDKHVGTEALKGRSGAEATKGPIKDMLSFVDHELAALSTQADLGNEIQTFDKAQLKHVETRVKDPLAHSKEIRGFDKTQLKHVATQEKPTDLKSLQVAAELEALWDKDADAALILGRAIEEDARLSPFAAAAAFDVEMARVAEKFVALSKLDKTAADALLTKALDKLDKGESLDSIKTELNQKLVAATLANDFAFATKPQGGVQDWSVAWNTKTAQNAANLLIDGAGRVDKGLIAELRRQLAGDVNRTTYSRGPHADHLKAMLDKLEKSATFRSAIEGVKAPRSQTSTGAAMVRSTLGMPEGAEVSDVDARRAVLSAVLADLRQNDVGSCFATSVAIRVHGHQPERLVADLARMIEHGSITRINGTGTAEVPVSGRMSTKDLQKQIQLDATGNVTHVSGQALPGALALHQVPGMNAALHALGIPDGEMAARIQRAVAETGTNTTPEAILRQIAMEEAGVSSEMLAARDDVQRLGAEIRVLNADASLAKLYSELRELKSNDAPGDQIKAKQQEIKTQEALINTKIEEYSKRHDAMLGRVTIGPARDPAALSRFDQKVAAGSNAFLGQMDNRLLRSWEYTVSAFAEQGEVTDKKKLTVQSLFGSFTIPDPGGRTLKGLDEKLEELFPGTDAEATKLRNEFKTRLDGLLTSRIQIQYDASRGVGAVSADGRSDRGTFTLYDNTGVKDPALWHRADNPDAFARMLSGMILEAGMETLAAHGVDHAKFRDSVDALATFAVTPELTEFSIRNLAKLYQNPEFPNAMPDFADVAITPWAFKRGAWEYNVEANYFEGGAATLNSVKSTPAPPANGRELMSWIIGQLQAMRPQIATQVDADPQTYSIPIANNPHAFLLMPGHADLRSAWNSGVSPDTWLNARLDVPGNQLSNRPLSDDNFNAVSGRVSPDLAATLQACKAQLEAAGTPVTPKQLHAKLEAELSGDPDKAVKLNSLDQAMVNALDAPSITFADSNWGGGGNHTHFAVVYNPGTGNAEVWCRPTDGSDRYPLDQKEWVKETNWRMTTNPRDFGEA